METTANPAITASKATANASNTTRETSNATISNDASTIDKSFKSVSPELKDAITHEINQMMAFAIHNGKTINTDIIPLIQKESFDNLIHAHNMLCVNVAPATPKSINYIFELNETDKEKSLITKLPLVRNLIIMAVIFLLAFILTGQSSQVNNASLDLGVMQNQGLSLVLNLGYLAAISGLGVVFYLLKDITTSVKNGTLIPEDSIYYVALIVLGIISGLVVSEILNVYISDADKIDLFNKSVLALIGGFSTDAIFSVLQGIINKIKGLFTPTN